MISSGLLKIPMEGFSPVRGQLTPVVINAGAWQRTITPVQLDRRANEAGVPLADLLRHLAAGGSSGLLQPGSNLRGNDLPAPAVGYWRQTADGDWGLGATCGAGN